MNISDLTTWNTDNLSPQQIEEMEAALETVAQQQSDKPLGRRYTVGDLPSPNASSASSD